MHGQKNTKLRRSGVGAPYTINLNMSGQFQDPIRIMVPIDGAQSRSGCDEYSNLCKHHNSLVV